MASTKQEEEAALSAVREALGAKHVIRVCSSYEQVWRLWDCGVPTACLVAAWRGTSQ